MRKLLFALALLLFCAPLLVAQPGIPLTAGIGVPGSAPTLCAAPVVMPSNADFTMTALQYACNSINVTSGVALTATRNIIAPLTVGQQFTITNSTTGGQSITLKGSTGSGVTIGNGQSFIVANPTGAGYVITGSSGVGTVTSVGLSLPTALFNASVPGSPVTGSGTLSPTLASQAANCFFAAPNGSAGTPSCRAMAAADVPALTTTVNTIACATGGSCTIPSFCAGAACPTGSQISVPYTIQTGLNVSLPIASTDTTINITSTTGFPPVGCGQLQFAGQREYICWASLDATHLFGVTRSYYNSTPSQTWSGTSPNIAAVIGITTSIASASTVAPQFVYFNNGSALYPGFVSFNSVSITGATITSASANFLTATSNGNATSGANFCSGQLGWTGSTWTGSAPVPSFVGISLCPGTGVNPILTLGFAHTGDTGPVVFQPPNLSVTGFSSRSIGTPVAAASTIAPTASLVHITGTGAIDTITPTAVCLLTGQSCSLKLWPDAVFTTTTAGNIALASTAVINRILELTYDPSISKWAPSY